MPRATQFFNQLKDIKAVAPVWEYVLIMLQQEYHLNDDILNLFILFFSMIDDGNVCISLDTAKLQEKWNKKLNGLDTPDLAIDYNHIIRTGILAIKKYANQNNLIFEYKVPNTKRKNNMFVIYKDWLFTEKFFDAKQKIEESVQFLFQAPTHAITIDTNEKERIKKYPRGYELDDKQVDAIVRAKRGENLIITGGPGTGKTTVIYYLLLELLAENKSCTVYMTAPSAKAAKRMQESVLHARNGLTPETERIRTWECDIIAAIKPVTIHSLLRISSNNNNTIKTFPKNSIFVIDEASMIDIVLFAKLFQAIKQSENARVFILGDKDQLPSVQPGSVFADLTETNLGALIELTKSQRFAEDSDIYKLKEYIRQPEKSDINLDKWTDNVPTDWVTELKTVDSKKYTVKYLTLLNASDIHSAVTMWYDAFYSDDKYKKVYSNLDFQSDDIIDLLNKIWACIDNAKILCAENQGMRGIDNINNCICTHIKKTYNLCATIDDKFFIGEQVIITQNQSMYDLNNGDIGIIVSLDNKKYIMIKRTKDITQPDTSNIPEIIRHIGGYVFYPLYLLPYDSVAPAYAITIHKSQGSEYNNIFVFLPESETSPLLNRQILYTAITRTKNTTYIVSDKNNLIKAAHTPVERNTQLFL